MNLKGMEDWFNVYYSQNMEDLILKSFFLHQKKGFYIDVGAHDPEYFSVTKLFYDLGWSGINVEPQIKYHERLESARKRDINLNIAVSNFRGKAMITEYPNADGLSTLSSKMVESYKTDKVFGEVTNESRRYKVNTMSLSAIFKKYCNEREVNFLKIDVEGFEEEVLLSNDWVLYRPWVICIEANHKVNQWEKILKNANYIKVFFDGLNEYYLADERKYLLESFDYSKTVLSKIPVSFVPIKVLLKEISDLTRNQSLQDKVIEKQDTYIHDLENKITHTFPHNLRNITKLFRKKGKGNDDK